MAPPMATAIMRGALLLSASGAFSGNWPAAEFKSSRNPFLPIRFPLEFREACEEVMISRAVTMRFP